MVHIPLRLILDSDALVSNWHWLAHRGGGAACGAAVKADGYGLGAREAVKAPACRLPRLLRRHLGRGRGADALAGDLDLSVLHGVGPEDLVDAKKSRARPVLNTREQVERWRGTGRPCDVMVDTGINRLGLARRRRSGRLLDGLRIKGLMSHLACADEDVPMNAEQRSAFAQIAVRVEAKRLSLASSAGICLGRDYAFDLTRPGLALYGGVPRREAEGISARWSASRPRSSSGAGSSRAPASATTPPSPPSRPTSWRSSISAMPTAICAASRAPAGRGSATGSRRWSAASRWTSPRSASTPPQLREGDWIELDYDLPGASAQWAWPNTSCSPASAPGSNGCGNRPSPP